MKRKKILATALAAAMIFAGVPMGHQMASASMLADSESDTADVPEVPEDLAAVQADTTDTEATKDIFEFVKSQDETMGTVAASVDQITVGAENSVTLTATPVSDAYKFVKWVVTDGAGISGSIVSENEDAQTTVILTGEFYYTAIFARKQEVNISLSEAGAVLTVGGDALELTAEVTGAENTGVTWKVVNTDGDEDNSVAVVADGIVTPVAAGEAIVVATALADTTKSATCTVTVRPKSVDKTGLWSAVLEAISTLQKDQEGEDIRYSAATYAAADQAMTKAAGVYQNKRATEQQVTEAEQELRTALDNLQEIYKVDIDVTQANGADVTVEAPEGEYRDESKEGHVIVYLPLVGKVSIVAAKTDGNGQHFKSWQIGGRVVSTNPAYTFYVIGTTNLEAEYSEITEKPEPEVNLFCTNKYSTTTRKLSFIGKRSLTSDYKVVEHGIVITDATGWAKYKNDQNAFVKGASRTKKSVAKGKANNGTYEAKLSCGKNEKWYGRSYVTYTDGTHIYTEYSQISIYSTADAN